jgi:DHA1 family tetracycline resistance protein-like MFS transporter
MGLLVLPESHRAEKRTFELPHLNPFRSLRWMFGLRGVLPFVLVYAIICCVGQVPQSIWVLYGEHQFRWDARTVGMTFAFFGLLYAVSQAFLTGRLTARFGERRTLLIALIADNAGFLMMALATQSWMGFAICIPLAIGGIAMPALQAILSKQVDEDQQGELQGTLVAVMALATIFGPVVVTNFYAATKNDYPSPVWLVGSLVYLLCFPIFWYGRREPEAETPADREETGESLEESPAADEYSSPVA